MTSVLKGSKFWLADGTFKLLPKNVYQFYTHQVYIPSIAPACLRALLSKQIRKKYSRFLDALEKFAPVCKPNEVLFDFENAPINAF